VLALEHGCKGIVLSNHGVSQVIDQVARAILSLILKIVFSFSNRADNWMGKQKHELSVFP
jgi:hypothetical protein